MCLWRGWKIHKKNEEIIMASFESIITYFHITPPPSYLRFQFNIYGAPVRWCVYIVFPTLEILFNISTSRKRVCLVVPTILSVDFEILFLKIFLLLTSIPACPLSAVRTLNFLLRLATTSFHATGKNTRMV